METLIKMCLIFPLISANPSTPPDLIESLKDPSIPVVAFHWKAYASLNREKSWSTCHFCLKCPYVPIFRKNYTDIFSEDIESELFTKSPEFFPCPEVLDLITHYVKKDDLLPDMTGRYTSEFTAISNTSRVRTTNRHWDVPLNDTLEEADNLHLPENFPDRVDVTKERLVLETLDSDRVNVNEFEYWHNTGSEKTWIEMSCKHNKRFLSITNGHFEGGDKVTETSSWWGAKDGLSRHALFQNMVELEEFRVKGCKCVRHNMLTLDQVYSQLVKKCRKETTGNYRKEIRTAAKISTCISREEVLEYKQKLRLKNNEL